MIRGSRTGLVVVAMLLAAACSAKGEGTSPSVSVAVSSASTAPATQTLYGYFELIDDDGYRAMRTTDELVWDEILADERPGCLGVGLYDDLLAGTPVGLYDAEGTLWSQAVLEGGATIEQEKGKSCRWSFRFEDAPTLDYYLVGVSNRSKVAYTAGELRDLVYFYITVGQG